MPRMARGSRLCHSHYVKILMTRAKALLHGQFNPTKTWRQLVKDRNCCRASIHAALVVFLCL